MIEEYRRRDQSCSLLLSAAVVVNDDAILLVVGVILLLSLRSLTLYLFKLLMFHNLTYVWLLFSLSVA